MNCITLSRSLDISGLDYSPGNQRDWMRWALRLPPVQQTVIWIFSVSIILWQGTLLAVWDYSKMDYATSCVCNTIFNSISQLLWFLLLDGGEASEILCLALRFLKSCHTTLKKVLLYNLTTPSQLYKVTNKHSQSTPRNPSVVLSCSAPALSHRVLIQKNNTKPGLRFYIKKIDFSFNWYFRGLAYHYFHLQW